MKRCRECKHLKDDENGAPAVCDHRDRMWSDPVAERQDGACAPIGQLYEPLMNNPEDMP